VIDMTFLITFLLMLICRLYDPGTAGRLSVRSN